MKKLFTSYCTTDELLDDKCSKYDIYREFERRELLGNIEASSLIISALLSVTILSNYL